jgi:hypothetical protein
MEKLKPPVTPVSIASATTFPPRRALPSWPSKLNVTSKDSSAAVLATREDGGKEGTLRRTQCAVIRGLLHSLHGNIGCGGSTQSLHTHAPYPSPLRSAKTSVHSHVHTPRGPHTPCPKASIRTLKSPPRDRLLRTLHLHSHTRRRHDHAFCRCCSCDSGLCG